jgi:hypothetical protein
LELTHHKLLKAPFFDKTEKNFKLECQFYLISLIFYYFMLIFYFTLFEYIAKCHFLKKNAILQFSYIWEIKMTLTCHSLNISHFYLIFIWRKPSNYSLILRIWQLVDGFLKKNMFQLWYNLTNYWENIY